MPRTGAFAPNHKRSLCLENQVERGLERGRLGLRHGLRDRDAARQRRQRRGRHARRQLLEPDRARQLVGLGVVHAAQEHVSLMPRTVFESVHDATRCEARRARTGISRYTGPGRSARATCMAAATAAGTCSMLLTATAHLTRPWPTSICGVSCTTRDTSSTSSSVSEGGRGCRGRGARARHLEAAAAAMLRRRSRRQQQHRPSVGGRVRQSSGGVQHA